MSLYHLIVRHANDRKIVIQSVAVGLFLFGYHKFLGYAMREASINLGAVKFNRHFVPLYAEPRVDLHWWLVPAILVCIGFLAVCRRYFVTDAAEDLRLQGSSRNVEMDNVHFGLRKDTSKSPLTSSFAMRMTEKRSLLLWIAVICFIGIHISVAQIDGYRVKDGERILALLEPYTRTSLEYYGDVPRVDEKGLGGFLRDYSTPAFFNTLSGHTRTHPPGGVIFLWGVSKIFGYNLVSASLASILFTALTLIPIYRLGTQLYGEKVGRYALALFLITPNFVMFTGTSMDGPFSVFPIFSLYLFYKAISLHPLKTGLPSAAPTERDEYRAVCNRATENVDIDNVHDGLPRETQNVEIDMQVYPTSGVNLLNVNFGTTKRAVIAPTHLSERLANDRKANERKTEKRRNRLRAIRRQLRTWNVYSLLTGVSLALGMFMTYSTVVIGVFLCILTLMSLARLESTPDNWRGNFVQHVKVLLVAGAGFVAFYLLLFVLTGFRPIEALWAAIKKDEAGMGTGYESVARYFHLSFANLFAFLIGVGIPITTVWIRHLGKTARAWRENGTIDTFVIGYVITLLFFTFSTLFTMEVERIWIFMVPFLIIPVAKHLTERPLADFYWVAGLLIVQLIVSEVLLYTYW